MREIKFRAWDKYEKEMLQPDDIRFLINSLGMVITPDLMDISWAKYIIKEKDFNGRGFIDRFILMQYTGLKDKNGKEIYEGDVFKTQLSSRWKVIFDNDKLRWIGVNLVTGDKLDLYKFPSIKAIGNIYEHKYLLETSDDS